MTQIIKFDIIAKRRIMAHLALYRQFRPKTFDEVIGEDHIVKTLKHQIQNGTISHAYLFCGTRGTGKTSCAKIFARAVNCLHPKDGSPCGECEVCQKIMSNGNLDIIEIDAASNNRVDEIRDLRDKVSYLPSVGKYKVYIIDEVHMLTDSAFNALLKTLEEPPSHIIFILATTEPEKLPATILSRCMRFDFKLVGVEALTKLLERILTKVGTKFEPKALELIARAGRGSVRDTLSVAEMCKAFANDNITYQSVEQCLGLTDDSTLLFLAESIVKKDGGNILQKVDDLYEAGKSMTTLLSDLCDFFKNVLMCKLAPTYNMDKPSNVLDNYKQIANLADAKFLVDVLKRLCDALAQIKTSANDKVFVETTLVGLFYYDNLELEMLKQQIANLVHGKIEISSQVTPKFSQDTSNLSSPTAQKNLQTKVQNVADDSPFGSDTKSQNVAEQQQGGANARAILGDLIGYSRNSKVMQLYASFADVLDVSISNETFILTCKQPDTKMVIDGHKDFILSYLSSKYNIKNIDVVVAEDKTAKKINALNSMLDGKLVVE